MTRFKGVVSSRLRAISFVVALMAVSCHDPNYDLGGEYLPNGHQTIVGSLDVADGAFTTSHKTDNTITVTNQTVGSIGFERTAELGERRSGFVSRYRSSYVLDDDVFGYDPIIDSILIYLSVNEYSGDTTQSVRFDVFELLNDDFIPEEGDDDDDSMDSQSSADIEAYLSRSGAVSERLFSFNLPDPDNGYYLVSTYAKALDLSEAGEAFFEKLLLLSNDFDDFEDDDEYELYDYDNEDFVNYFKGLVIRPADESEQSFTGDGLTVSFTYASTGFGFYGRSKYPEAPTLIKDTIGMTYAFVDSYSSLDYFTANLIERDYTGSVIADSSDSEQMIIEGMCGVVSEVTINQAFFEQFEAVMETANVDVEGEPYTTVFFNTARLGVYLSDATGYDGYVIVDDDALDALNYLPTRLGAYTLYSTYADEDYEDFYWEMETALDYDYSSETSTGYASNFGGYLNRTLGRYTMDLPLMMQEMWSEYADWKESGEDWSTVDWNKFYIAPLVENIFTPKVVRLQGTGGETAPITMSVTYTLLKD